MIQSGELAARVADGLRGMTSNPSIFESAIGGSKDYDAALAGPAMRGQSDVDAFEAIAVEDVAWPPTSSAPCTIPPTAPTASSRSR